MPQSLKTIFLSIAMVYLATGRVSGQNYVTPEVVTTLPGELNETSGLLNLGGELWSHNDSGDDAVLYQFDPAGGAVIRTVEVTNAENVDWEDITQDDSYVYIGDIGNNDGSRTDLKIYRVARSDLENSDEVEADVISYHYSDQTSFEPSYHNTNFDCEALLHYDGNLYLFTKNWLDYQTNCYILPKVPGDYEATLISSFNAGCLVSGATLVPAAGMVVLIGYTPGGGSYNWLFSGFGGDDFFSAQNTKLIWTVLSQIEGVCDMSGSSIYISSEEFAGFLDPTLYSLDLTGFISATEAPGEPRFNAFASGERVIISAGSDAQLTGTMHLLNTSGMIVRTMKFTGENQAVIGAEGLHGVYFLTLSDTRRYQAVKIFIP